MLKISVITKNLNGFVNLNTKFPPKMFLAVTHFIYTESRNACITRTTNFKLKFVGVKRSDTHKNLVHLNNVTTVVDKKCVVLKL